MVCVCVFFFFFVLVEMCMQKMKKKKSAETVGVGWWNPTVRAEPVIDTTGMSSVFCLLSTLPSKIC